MTVMFLMDVDTMDYMDMRSWSPRPCPSRNRVVNCVHPHRCKRASRGHVSTNNPHISSVNDRHHDKSKDTNEEEDEGM
jgi:hypothetical protein